MNVTAGPPLFPSLGQLLGAFEADAIAAREAHETKRPRGPVTGLPHLDERLGGFLQPGVHVVHGVPAVGKSAFGLQIAADCGFPSLFISCEMGAVELFRRIAARGSNCFLGRFKTGELSPAEALGFARTAIAKYPDLALMDATIHPADWEHIRDVVAGKDGAPGLRGAAKGFLIVLDSLHSWAQAAYAADKEYDALNAGIADLQKLAATLVCPVLVISERNRESMDKGGQNAGAGTRKIEYCAETVLDLTKEKDATEDAFGEYAVYAKLAKNRHGATGKKVDLKFHGALQRFREG